MRNLKEPKCAQPLSVRNYFSFKVSLCSNIHVFQLANLHTLCQQKGAGTVSQLFINVDIKLREKRICRIIMSTTLKYNLQIQGHKTWIWKNECGQCQIGPFMEIRSQSIKTFQYSMFLVQQVEIELFVSTFKLHNRKSVFQHILGYQHGK